MLLLRLSVMFIVIYIVTHSLYIYIYIYDYMGEQCPNSMFIDPVNEDEVVLIIKSCKP